MALDADGLTEAFGDVLAEALGEADGFGETAELGLADGEGLTLPVGVQPAKSAAARMTHRVSAMSFFMIIISLPNILTM